MKILVVEDDKGVSEMLRKGLSASSHVVEIAEDGNAGSFLARSYEYDAILLDYSLPHKNGLALCREIRGSGKTTPIIFLSVMSDTQTKVSALEQGADDYITKPFSIDELQARLKAVSRRPSQVNKQTILKVGDLVLDTNRQTVTLSGKIVHITRKEFSLLEYMMRNAGVVLSRAMIMEHVWTSDTDPLSNTVESHIRNLRRKLSQKNKPSMIKNVTGRGYCIESIE